MSQNIDLSDRRVRRRSILRSIGGGVLGATLAASAGTTRAAKQSPPNEIVITKDENGIEDGVVTYQFAVGTDLKGVSAEAGEVVDGNHADGRVGPLRGTDAFRFAGPLVDFDLEGDAAVYVNGEQVDPALLTNTIHIQSTAEDRAFYEIAVDGELRAGVKADLSGATHPDTATKDSTSGSVAGEGVDTYHFAGDLTRLSVEEPTVVRVNNEAVEELPNTLVIESTAEDRATYEVSVAGQIGAGVDADLTGATHPDAISGGNSDFVAERGTEASGSVASGGADSYRFVGDVTDLDVDGPAESYINGERVHSPPDGSDDEPGIVEQCGDTTLRVVETAQFVNYDANETDVDIRVINEGNSMAENVTVEIVAEDPDEAITTIVNVGKIAPDATKVATGTVPGTHDKGEAGPRSVSCGSER